MITVNVRDFHRYLNEESPSQYRLTVVWQNPIAVEDLDNPEFTNTITNIETHPLEGLDIPLNPIEVKELFDEWLEQED